VLGIGAGMAMAAGLAAGPASAAPSPASTAAPATSVLAGQTMSGNPIPCPAQADGVRVCYGTYNNGPGGSDIRLKTFDGSPLELYVILPPAPASGTDGHYPFVAQSHGWGQRAGGTASTQYLGPTADAWARSGYAVLQLSSRGWGDSCATAASRLANPAACQNGFIRLDDDRYEVRDIQYATGLLVDQRLVDPNRIGATGESYGGGVSLQLATLKDRVMNADGSLSSWTSPDGARLHIAAAAPVIPWSDLDYSLTPNGRTLDYQITSPTADLSPVGWRSCRSSAGCSPSAPPAATTRHRDSTRRGISRPGIPGYSPASPTPTPSLSSSSTRSPNTTRRTTCWTALMAQLTRLRHRS
jgi:hypothetical protein